MATEDEASPPSSLESQEINRKDKRIVAKIFVFIVLLLSEEITQYFLKKGEIFLYIFVSKREKGEFQAPGFEVSG